MSQDTLARVYLDDGPTLRIAKIFGKPRDEEIQLVANMLANGGVLIATTTDGDEVVVAPNRIVDVVFPMPVPEDAESVMIRQINSSGDVPKAVALAGPEFVAGHISDHGTNVAVYRQGVGDGTRNPDDVGVVVGLHSDTQLGVEFGSGPSFEVVEVDQLAAVLCWSLDDVLVGEEGTMTEAGHRFGVEYIAAALGRRAPFRVPEHERNDEGRFTA